MATVLRVVVGEDQIFVREGIVRMLGAVGVDVVGVASTAPDVVAVARVERPDVVVTDIQMPPAFTDDGLRAALQIRGELPGTGVLVLSQYLEDEFVLALVESGAGGVGYLLKEKVADPDVLLDAIRRVAAGDSALDPDVIGRLVGRKRAAGPLNTLTPRERDVLELMAQGLSNTAIAQSLFVTVPAVERHVTGIFLKLGLSEGDSLQHRRVAAVLQYLKATTD